MKEQANSSIIPCSANNTNTNRIQQSGEANVEIIGSSLRDERGCYAANELTYIVTRSSLLSSSASRLGRHEASQPLHLSVLLAIVKPSVSRSVGLDADC